MLTFEEKEHVYRWNGEIVPSPTQVLGRVGVRVETEAGESWRSISGMEFANNPAAMNFGTQFHRYAGATLKGQKVLQFDPLMTPWIESFKNFRREHDFLETILLPCGRPAVETPLYCSRHRFAMTPDWAVMADGHPVVIDWKTSEEFHDHWWMQLAAYACGLSEATGLTGWRTWIVQPRAGERAIKREHCPHEIRADMNKFVSILNTYRMAA